MYVIRNRSRRVDREIDSLIDRDYKRVAAAIDSLAENPRPSGCVKLQEEIYRIRVGAYRIVYLVDDLAQRIEIGAVRRRSESTYRNIAELFS